MEPEDRWHLCFPQLPNISCRKPSSEDSEDVFFRVLLPVECVATVLLNLLVIVSISHFRHKFLFFSVTLGGCFSVLARFSACVAFEDVQCLAGKWFRDCVVCINDVFFFFLLSLLFFFVLVRRQLHTPTNLVLLSLAVADFLVGSVSMPKEIYKNASCWFLGDVMCSLWNYVIFISSVASVGNIVLISADRYVAICDPLRYKVKVTVKRVQLCVCLCWLTAVLHCGIVLMDQLAHPGMYNSCLGECVIGFEFYGGLLDLVVCFVLPLGVIIALYMRVFAVAVSQARAVRSHVRCLKLQRRGPFGTRTSEMKAAGTLGLLVLVFLACFCPYFIVNLVAENSTTASVGKYVLYLYDFNSCVNPLIYALFYPWFRRAAKHIVTLRILRPGSREASNIL
ncbi:trace amine-associated receptor 1-like [Hippocampus zosterae]|uniref:trace amine-associated receptor 1-like n=1 Tax=Hippocampus zosterae TaxID=109293 RepID=UPI00223CA554|nr:trace amine-associated receptor 1-like [Hippocampus zosterae]